MEGPDSSYSCLEIHICWKVDREARMEPPIQTEYFLSGGAIILIFIVLGAGGGSCEPVFEQVCTDILELQCETEFEEVCTIETNVQYEEQCEESSEQQCYTTYEEECTTEITQQC